MFEPHVLGYFLHNSLINFTLQNQRGLVTEPWSVSLTSMRQIFITRRINCDSLFSHIATVNYIERKTHKKMWLCSCFAVEIHTEQTHYLSHVKGCNWRQETLSNLFEQIKATSEQLGAAVQDAGGSRDCCVGIVELQVFLSLVVK